ncbi:hypothetical protein HAX54_050892 [Datura stramonium]|uniref:Uncharacterized protein n=1 Tax=Datura stramonium TaxID=4076 RepID=A0ABS8SXK1_DATST|nr:hypothetical protein [Datura stramonium]
MGNPIIDRKSVDNKPGIPMLANVPSSPSLTKFEGLEAEFGCRAVVVCKIWSPRNLKHIGLTEEITSIAASISLGRKRKYKILVVKFQHEEIFQMQVCHSQGVERLYGAWNDHEVTGDKINEFHYLNARLFNFLLIMYHNFFLFRRLYIQITEFLNLAPLPELSDRRILTMKLNTKSYLPDGHITTAGCEDQFKR